MKIYIIMYYSVLFEDNEKYLNTDKNIPSIENTGIWLKISN